jgi:hypothetical protein
MTFAEVKAILAEENPQALFADGLEEACIGIARRCGQPSLAVYDYNKVVELFMADGMSYEEAVEWVEYNVVGAWMGDNTPVWFQQQSE